MSNEIHPANPSGNGGYERSDIGVAPILYFLLGLAVAGVLAFLVVDGLYHFLDKRSEAEQTPVNPLVTNAPADTRHIPPEYKGDYGKYLDKNFPSPQLEIDEHTKLTEVRLQEEQTLATYDWIDKNAGTVRIPIDRAMDLIAQRGLPVRAQTGSTATAAAEPESTQPEKAKNKKKAKK
jgi:hypothetical protein